MGVSTLPWRDTACELGSCSRHVRRLRALEALSFQVTVPPWSIREHLSLPYVSHSAWSVQLAKYIVGLVSLSCHTFFLLSSLPFPMFLQHLRQQYLKMLTAETVDTTHVQLLPIFWFFFSFQLKNCAGRIPFRHHRRQGDGSVIYYPFSGLGVRQFHNLPGTGFLPVATNLSWNHLVISQIVSWELFYHLTHTGIFRFIDSLFGHLGSLRQYQVNRIFGDPPVFRNMSVPFCSVLLQPFSLFFHRPFRVFGAFFTKSL